MSEENVEIVGRAFAYEIYGLGDRADAEELFDPNVVLNATEESPYYGPDGMRDDWERWASAWVELRVTVEEIIDAGDQVILVAHHQGRARGSGINVDARLYEVYTLREGKVSRVDEYTEREQALEAPGCRSRRSRLLERPLRLTARLRAPKKPVIRRAHA
jgi:ketosteroid isomerase-like protein